MDAHARLRDRMQDARASGDTDTDGLPNGPMEDQRPGVKVIVINFVNLRNVC